jgi:hypothetical protein
MKTISGLNDSHLRFDVGKFVSQLRQNSGRRAAYAITSTHPSIVVRCRALLWFSLDDSVLNPTKCTDEASLKKLDNRIVTDLEKYVDAPAIEKIESCKRDLELWMYIHEIVQNGIFDKREQEIIAKHFGVEILGKLKNFMGNTPKKDLEEAVFNNMRHARETLEGFIPISFESEVQRISKKVALKFV